MHAANPHGAVDGDLPAVRKSLLKSFCATLGAQKNLNASLTRCVELRNCMLLQLLSREMRDTFFKVMLQCAILYRKS